MGKAMLNLEKFRSNDCLFQLKIMGTVLRRGIPELEKILYLNGWPYYDSAHKQNRYESAEGIERENV
jgi:hypothetical protein